MPLFRRILQVDPGQIQQAEQRLAKRFTIPEDSPLRAEVLVGPAALPVRLHDVSTTGARVAFTGDRAVAPEAGCTVRLIIDDMVIKLVATIANVNLTEGETQLGLRFAENKFEARQDLVQLLEPIEVGASLKEVDGSMVKQTEPGLLALRYFSTASSSLTLWRSLEDDQIQGFEMHLRQYFVRNGSAAPNLKIYLDDGTQAFGYAAPTLQQANDVSADVTKLFRWIVPHLNPTVPADVREFLQRYAA